MQQQFEPNQTQTNYQPTYIDQTQYQGPRRMSFFTLILKVLAGLTGGAVGTIALLLIFLLSSSTLQPLLTPAETQAEEISAIFIIILIGMIFATSVLSSIVAPLLLSLTERERYTKLSTSIYQIFLFNLVILLFVSPIYLASSVDRIELSAYAAGLQVILSALSSSLIVEILNDYRYSIIGVYTSVVGVLVATALNLLIYFIFGNPTMLLFTALPTLWGSIGFFQGTFAMMYFWYFSTWGKDPLSIETSYGSDYGIENPEPNEEELPPDREGSDFLRNS